MNFTLFSRSIFLESRYNKEQFYIGHLKLYIFQLNQAYLFKFPPPFHQVLNEYCPS